MTMPLLPGNLPEAKHRLVIEAERAFAEQGIAGASLREITERAGHRNRSAAQYHFGDRDGLVLAVLRYRRPQVDMARRRFFDAQGLSVEDASPEMLVEAVIGPLLFSSLSTELQDYARTVYALLHYDIDGSIWQRASDAAPFTREIYSALRAHSRLQDDGQWWMRQWAFGRCCVDITANRATAFPANRLDDPASRVALFDMLAAMLLPGRSGARKDADQLERARTNCTIWRTISCTQNAVT